MTRVKRGTTSLKRRKNILKMTKGFRFGRSTKERQANEALFSAGRHAFNDRRKKKGIFRKLWNIRINASLHGEDLSYSKLIKSLNDKNIKLNRKMLAELSDKSPEAYQSVLNEVK